MSKPDDKRAGLNYRAWSTMDVAIAFVVGVLIGIALHAWGVFA